MKKLIISTLMLLLAVIVCFAQKPTKQQLSFSIGKLVAQTRLEQPNPGASTNAQAVVFHIKDTFANAKNPMAEAPGQWARHKFMEQECPAWVLNENWLITSARCGKASTPYKKDIKLKTHELFLANHDFTFAKNNHIMLIWKSNDEADLSFTAPFAKLLAWDTPRRLLAEQLKNKIVLSTGSNTKERIVEPSDYVGQYAFRINKKASHVANSLFLITPTGSEFLTAFSNVSYEYNQVGVVMAKSNVFTSLTKKDLQFIKVTVRENRPADWAQIKTRLFYNDTKTPYFND